MAKYRQPGYQDRDREPRREETRKAPPERKSGPPRWDHALGPKPVNLPGTRAVSRCVQCGTVLQGMPAEGKCPKCGLSMVPDAAPIATAAWFRRARLYEPRRKDAVSIRLDQDLIAC